MSNTPEQECVDRLEVLVAGLMAMTDPLPEPILEEMNRALDALIICRGNPKTILFGDGDYIEIEDNGD